MQPYYTFGQGQGQQQQAQQQQHETYGYQNHVQGQVSHQYVDSGAIPTTNATARMQMAGQNQRSSLDQQQTFQTLPTHQHFYQQNSHAQFNPYESYMPSSHGQAYAQQVIPQQMYQQFNNQAFQQQQILNQPQYTPQIDQQQLYHHPSPVQAQQRIPPALPNFQTVQQNISHVPMQQAHHATHQPPTKSDMPNRILQDSSSNKPPPTNQSTVKQQPQIQPVQAAHHVDPTTQYPSLLLTLADEYIDAAKSLPARSKQYYDLVSTAIGCMDLTLRNFKLEPLREAQLRLKYAQVLYDETTNKDEAELALKKGIDLCDNMKFIDLRYAMKSLLIKVSYRSNVRAAKQDLKKLVEDVETYRHTAWEYAFRFQAVFLAINPDGQISMHDAFHQLTRIQHVAKLNGDHGIYAYASIMEALLHLHIPGSESVQQSQRALAQARSLQLNPDVENHPQMPVLMDMIDLIWSILSFNEKEVATKRAILKDTIYEKGVDNPNWPNDEATWLRVNASSLRGVQVQDGGLIHHSDGKYYLALSWIGKKEIETLGFLLIGVALVPSNQQLKGKAVNFLEGGLPLVIEEMLGSDKMFSGQQERMVRRCHILCMHLKAETAFLRCAQGKWSALKESITFIETHLKECGKEAPEEFITTVLYLKGCHAQGTGDLKRALECYTAEPLLLKRRDENQGAPKMSTTEQTIHSFKVLAAMNSVLIIRAPDHPYNHQVSTLIKTIQSNIFSNSPQLLEAAQSIILSSLPSLTTLQLKSVLGDALKYARNINNHQIISLTLTLMQDKFFRGGVQSAQAVSCAKAAAHQVRSKWGEPLWMVVADMMQLESLKLQQDPQDLQAQEAKHKDMAMKQAELQRAWGNVPESVKEMLGK